jgi:hypothetical protein
MRIAGKTEEDIFKQVDCPISNPSCGRIAAKSKRPSKTGCPDELGSTIYSSSSADKNTLRSVLAVIFSCPGFRV